MDKNKKSSLQVKAVKGLVAFLIIMFLLTILSRAADSLTIAKVTASSITGGVLTHSITADGEIEANKEIAISTVSGIKIASVEATEGKSVEKGDTLIQLDTDDLKEKLLQTQNELAVLEATASDKAANEAIADANEAKSVSRAYEDYNTTVSNANDMVSDAKDAMDKALEAYNSYKSSGGSSGSSDTTVLDSLTKTVEEKQAVYDAAVTALENLNSEIEYKINDAIKEAATTDESGNTVEATDKEKKAIREEIEKSYESQLKAANEAVESAKEDLDAADTALSAYEAEQSSSSESAYEEQLQALYDAYVEKKDAYNDALEQKEQTIKDAKRTLEDATNTTETVDTASALTESNDLELKQMEVDELQALMDVDGVITATTAGLVTKVLVTTGETTTEDTAIRIADQSSGYKFTATIEKETGKYLSTGDTITLDIGNNTTVDGLTIDNIEVSPEDKNYYVVTVSIPAKVTNLGSIATMSIEKSTKKYDSCVPLTALHSDGDSYYIYAISETEGILGISTSVDKVEVTVLDKNNESAAIEGSFTWGQQVVLTSTKTLRSGDRVRVLGSE